jgi:hypothetical protein
VGQGTLCCDAHRLDGVGVADRAGVPLSSTPTVQPTGQNTLAISFPTTCLNEFSDTAVGLSAEADLGGQPYRKYPADSSGGTRGAEPYPSWTWFYNDVDQVQSSILPLDVVFLHSINDRTDSVSVGGKEITYVAVQ